MSFPCKENVVFFESIAKRQRLIYNDAADVGYPVDEAGKNLIRRELQELVDFYGSKSTRWGHQQYSHGSTTNVCVPIEEDERDSYSCLVVKITHNFNFTHKKEFFVIEFERIVCSKAEAIGAFNSRVFK